MSNFCHLHVHNEYSMLDGLGSAAAMVERAKELGMTHLALTNHGNIDGCIRFQNACVAGGITPIFGFEGYIVENIAEHPKGEKRCHIVIWAKNETGWINICKMLSIAYLEGHHYRPRISPKILLDHLDGLAISTACTSSFLGQEWGVKLYDELRARGVDLFLEIMPLLLEEQKDLNKVCLDLAKRDNIPIIATNDCHYINAKDSELQEVLLAMQSHTKWKDPNRWKFSVDDLYMKSREEMEESFKKQGTVPKEIYEKALDNTMLVAELCGNFLIPERPVDLPLPREVRDKDPNKFIKDLCKKALKEKIKNDPIKNLRYSEYVDRYMEEIDLITKQGFVVYFLIVWELINWCRSTDIMVGPGRGSSGGSLVCYLLNITTVDPIEHSLLFARFISPARIDLPDIDMDFEDRRRGEIRTHLEEVYGVNNVAGVSTYSSMKGRGALRDVSRVFDVPVMEVGKAASCIVVRSGGDFRSDFTIEDAFNTFEDGIKFKQKYPKETQIAIDIEGQVKGKGQHAAAMLICKEDLRDGIRGNLLYAKDKRTVINWDKHDVEHVGLMKLDCLGLNALTILNEARKLAKKNKGVDINFEKIPIDDPECYKAFSEGNNIGCFQVGSLGLRRLCVQLGIDNFQMLVHATSLHRPGTLRSGMVEEFVLRKRKEKEWNYVHPALEAITKDTFGIILYQEQVMRFMYDLGGLGWRTADTVRKVISKSQGAEQFMKFKDLFVQGCIDRGTLDKDTAEQLWNELSSFGSYGFNLSHAVEYTYITYWDMWMKIHYPEEFICAALTYGPEDKKEEILEEAYRLGLKIEFPKVGFSSADLWSVKDKVLYMPFCAIKGIGEVTAKQCQKYGEIINKGQGFFDTKKNKDLGTKTKNLLEQIHAFDKNRVLTEEEMDDLSDFFSMPIIRDPSRKYKKVMEKISDFVEISQLGDIDWTSRPDDKVRYYFGRMTEIRFGYKEKVATLSSDKHSDNLGGVYGNMKDDTDFVMVIFIGELYNRRKDDIEHCSGQYLLVKTKRARNNLLCSEVWFQDQILAGDLEGLPTHLKNRLMEYSDYLKGDIQTCERCGLSISCKQPIPYTEGRTNAMIIGEYPGRNEARIGRAFSGEVYNHMWDNLGLQEKLFHCTNVVKCSASNPKDIDKKSIKACSVWLDAEIKAVKPYIILAFGNIGLQYFKGLSSGIMEWNGKTEWNDKVGAWVCYCISPASSYFHQENLPMFKEGLDNFAEKYISLGKKKF